MIWKILEIEETKDEEVIKAAYREKLRSVNPEDDQEGFMELRRAYEEAMQYATKDENESMHNLDENRSLFQGKKNEVDLWIDKVDVVYRDVKTRVDESRWNTLFKDSVCDDLDTELEAAEKLLVYFMGHSYMPQNIWQLVDKRFHYMENLGQLKEKFPENYLEYVRWQINRPGFIDYDLFEGETDKDVDSYINKLYEVKSVSEERDLDKLKKLVNELKRFEVTHPFTATEEARCLVLEAELLGEEDETNTKIQQCLGKALSIMEDLEFEYSENPYIVRIYAEVLIKNGRIDKAKAIYEELLEKDVSNYSAMLGKAECIFLEGNPEEAKELIEDVLEDHVQDAEALGLLDRVNAVLVEKYEARIKEEKFPDVYYKLGWCYYQQKRFEEGVHLLDQLECVEEYDYVNLRCRLYLASDNYEMARPWADKWLRLIEESEDDGSKEMKKRKNRLSLAHFSIGVCIWEDEYKQEKEEKKKDVISRVIYYLEKAIAEESNLMVKFSYMEQLARFYLDAKHYVECIEICNEIIEEDRGFFPAYVHRQKANYELKNAKEVIDDYFMCIDIYPAYAQPYILAAEVFYAYDQYDDVEQVIASAKEAGVESDSLELYQIRCLHYKQFSKDNTKKALEILTQLREKVKICEQEETDIEDMVELEKEYAILHWDLDNTSEALSIIEDYLKKNPDDTSMLHLKADVLVREKRPAEAVEICKHLVELEPMNLHTKTRLGNCYERVDEIENAIKCYNEVLSENPDFVPALRRMMYVYSYTSNEKNDLDLCAKAVDYATRYIDLTDSAEGYVERGNLYIDLYELEKSVEDCKKAIDLDADVYYAYNNLGCALLKLRRVDEAIVPLEQVIAMDPDRDHLPYLNLAECYALKGEYEKAVQMYQEVMRLRPRATHLRKEIADIYIKAKQYDKALEVYKKMLEDAQSSKRTPSLIEMLKKTVDRQVTEEDKRVQSIYCDIADVYRQMGNNKMAEETYAKMWPRRFGGKISASAAGKIAEYYRDQGDLKSAQEILRYMLSNITEDELGTQDAEHLDFVRATVFFELKDDKNTKICADRFLKKFLGRHHGEEALLRDERYRRMYLYVLVVMYICTGRMDLAKKYLDAMATCKLCVTCTSCDCYEFYFAHGLIAECEGRQREAITFYRKAIEVKGDYPCAQRHLEMIESNDGKA